MYLKTVFELIMVLDTDKFERILARAYGSLEKLDGHEYFDRSLVSKGLTFIYRDSQYKKKVKILVDTAWVLDGDKPDPDRLIRKLEKRIDDYFDSKYRLNDFMLTGMVIQNDIDVHDREKAAAYISVLKRVGKVKGFTPTRDSWLDNDIAFMLDGNSNATEFIICDLEGLLRERLDRAKSGRKQLKEIIKKSTGLLRAEVKLSKPKAIRTYTDEPDTAGQIAKLSKKSEDVFLSVFTRIVPFGDFLKMDKAKEVIRTKVSDERLRRRCLRLLDLVPEKRSLLLAQKALNYRRIEDVMEAFTDAEVSPVTLSKRSEIKKIDNLYKYV